MQMTLSRKSDGALLTDRVFSWGGWDEPPAPRRDTISGVPVSFPGQRARPRTTTIQATFSPTDGNSSLNALDEIRRLHHRGQLMVFRDREGEETDVRVLEWTQEAWEESKVKTIVNVTLLLLDVRVIY